MHRSLRVLAAVLTLAACAGEPRGAHPLGSATGVPEDIRGEWQMTELIQDGATVPLPEGVEGTLVVDRKRLGGTAFCNGFGGDYELEGGRLELGDLLTTAMACSGEVGRAEGLYLEALTASDVGAAFQKDHLVVTGDGVELRFLPRPPLLADDLAGTSWLLQAVTADGLGTIALGESALLVFRPDGTFRAGTGCGAVSGTWDARPDGVSSSVVDHVADCPEELREQDEHVAGVFGRGFDAALSLGRLTLTSPGGRSVEYVDSADHD